ncbi:MAG: CPBP family intramembrane glutamic endopeptidase [Chitinophagaceae bacterium]|jgi:hypothetical protein
MRYWRHYPKFLQIILLMLMIFTLVSFSSVIAGVSVTPIFDVSLKDLAEVSADSLPKVIAGTQYVQGIVSLFTFLLSALLFAYLTHPEPINYLGLRKPAKSINVAIVVLLLVSFMPIVNQLGSWLQHIDFGAKAKASFEHNEMVMKTLMRGTTPMDFAIHMLVFALIPAIGEELLFRGVIMRISYSNSQNIHFAILIAAAIFGIAHGSVYNFLPIMLMGVLLGYIYYLSGSIWLSILAHFMNNALAALGIFLINTKSVAEEVGTAENFPWYVLVISLGLFVAAFSLLRKNATPLPPDWSDDFKGERQTS